MNSRFHFLAWWRVILVLVAVIGTSISARADDPAAGGNWTVQVECQMVVLPQKFALPLLPDLKDDDRIEVVVAKLQTMFERGEATLVANLAVRGEAGQRMVAENIEEMRYATEFTIHELPKEFPKENAAEVLKHWPLVGVMPTAFETRNVGTSLDVEAKVSNDGQWISLDAAPQHVRFLHFAKTDAGVLPTGEHLSVEQPIFSTLKDTSKMRVKSGQWVLAGVHKITNDEENMELFLLRVRSRPAGN